QTVRGPRSVSRSLTCRYSESSMGAIGWLRSIRGGDVLMLRLYLFGAPRVVRNGQGAALGRTKSLPLLAYLAVMRQRQEREVLLGLLWAELEQAAACNNLRRELSQLKRGFGDTLRVSVHQIAWNTQAAQWLDVAAFIEQIAAARQLPPQTEAWVSALTGAVEFASDDFLAGFSLADSPQFEEGQVFWRAPLGPPPTSAPPTP